MCPQWEKTFPWLKSCAVFEVSWREEYKQWLLDVSPSLLVEVPMMPPCWLWTSPGSPSHQRWQGGIAEVLRCDPCQSAAAAGGPGWPVPVTGSICQLSQIHIGWLISRGAWVSSPFLQVINIVEMDICLTTTWHTTLHLWANRRLFCAQSKTVAARSACESTGYEPKLGQLKPCCCGQALW